MVKSSKTGWNGFKPPTASKPKEQPTLRKSASETVFCDAIKRKVLVAFRYKQDAFERTFGPDAVYRAVSGKVLVEGFKSITRTIPASTISTIGLRSAIRMGRD